jgi:hypothetical protein
MDRRGWYVVAATVVIGIESTANASSQSAGRMTAHLVNYAGVPANDVNEAQREAAEIYAAAGIELLWVLGNQEDHPTVGVDVRVVLLDRVMSAETINEGHLGEDVLGVGGQAGWAYVFVHRVTLRSLSAHACFSRVLGRVVAHEIGRVLLPFHSHTPSGIMQPSVDMRPRGDRYFTQTQSETLLRTLTAAH